MALPVVPTAGCYVGTSLGGNTLAGYNTELHAYHADANFAAFRTYYHIDQPTLSARDVTNGATGAYGWFSYRPDTASGTIYTWNSYTAGTRDALINSIADGLHAYGHPCWVTFCHEPIHLAHTQTVGVWSGTNWPTGSPTAAQAASVATEWRAAYEHFVAVVKARYVAQGWTLNVAFAPILQHYYWQVAVYAPVTQWVPSTGIDWIAVDTYGTAQTADFYGAYKAFYDWAHANHSTIPLANCETVHNATANRPAWLYTSPAASGSLNFDMPNKMPQMKMWFYWNQNGGTSDFDSGGSDTASIQAMANLILAVGVATTNAPVLTTAPTVTGSLIEGSVLTAHDGSYTGTPAVTTTRHWQLSTDNVTFTDLSGPVTTATYTVPGSGAVVGDYYRIRVTATNGVSPDVVTDSASVGPITAAGAAPVNTVLPAITGTVTEGQTLTCSNGTWTGSPTFAFQWQTSATGAPGSFSNIGGETASTHVIAAATAGAYLTCVVTGHNGSGDTVVTANRVGPVAPLVPPNTAPALSLVGPPTVVVLPGTPQVTATATDVDGIASVTIALDGGSPVAMTNTMGNLYFKDLGLAAEGSHNFSVVATDSNATPRSTTVTGSFVVVPAANPITISNDVEEIELRFHQRGLQ